MASSDTSTHITPYHEKIGFYYLNFKPGCELYTTIRAVVFEGFHSRTKKKIVAKRIRVGDEKEYVEMAENEADILMNSPPHDNVIRVLNVIKENVPNKVPPEVDIFIFMEYGELGDLTKYMYERDLNIIGKLNIMLQCALGLQHLHGLTPQVIHRDLKPQNVFLFGDPASPTAKLGDLGEALFLQREDDKTVPLHSLRGTESYMAPELFTRPLSALKYTKMVDVFALGMSFLSLLNAKKGKTMKAMKGELILIII